MQTTPQWTNHCGHESASYQATTSNGNTVYDVYMFTALHGGIEVCARYGNAVEAYLGIGSMSDLINGSLADERYRRILGVCNDAL